MKTIISLFLIVICIPFAFAIVEPSKPFCEDQGYTYGQIGDGTNISNYVCIFDDLSTCPAFDFMDGKCGVKYRKETVCKVEGQALVGASGCCDGLESSQGWWNRGVVGQATCVAHKNFFQKLGMFFANLI